MGKVLSHTSAKPDDPLLRKNWRIVSPKGFPKSKKVPPQNVDGETKQGGSSTARE